jgi:hypothetical protein
MPVSRVLAPASTTSPIRSPSALGSNSSMAQTRRSRTPRSLVSATVSTAAAARWPPPGDSPGPAPLPDTAGVSSCVSAVSIGTAIRPRASSGRSAAASMRSTSSGGSATRLARTSTTVSTPARRAASRSRRPMSDRAAGSDPTTPSIGTSSRRPTRTAPDTDGRIISLTPTMIRPTARPRTAAMLSLVGSPRGSGRRGTWGEATTPACPAAAASSASRLRSADRSEISRSMPASRFCATGSRGLACAAAAIGARFSASSVSWLSTSLSTSGSPPMRSASSCVTTTPASAAVTRCAIAGSRSLYATSTTAELPRPVTTTRSATLSARRSIRGSLNACVTTSRLVAIAWTWLTTPTASACARGMLAPATIRAWAVYMAGWRTTKSPTATMGTAIAISRTAQYRRNSRTATSLTSIGTLRPFGPVASPTLLRGGRGVIA